MKRLLVIVLALAFASPALAQTKSPFGTRPLNILPVARPSAAQAAKPAAPTNNLNPINWLHQFSAADLQNALNDALRIDAVCVGAATATTTVTLTSCSGTPRVGDNLSGTGLPPVTVTAVGTFTNGVGSITVSTAQTVSGNVTATNPTLPVDIVTAPCWQYLLGLLQAGDSTSILQTTPGIASGIQKIFDDEALLLTWFNPGGTFDQFGVACSPLINKVNVQVLAGGAAIASGVAGGPGASAALLGGLKTILGGAIALPKL